MLALWSNTCGHGLLFTASSVQCVQAATCYSESLFMRAPRDTVKTQCVHTCSSLSVLSEHAFFHTRLPVRHKLYAMGVCDRIFVIFSVHARRRETPCRRTSSAHVSLRLCLLSVLAAAPLANLHPTQPRFNFREKRSLQIRGTSFELSDASHRCACMCTRVLIHANTCGQHSQMRR